MSVPSHSANVSPVQSLVTLLRLLLVVSMATVALRLLLLPQAGVGARSPVTGIGFLIGGVLLLLPWQRWVRARPTQLLTLAATVAVWVALHMLQSSWLAGSFMAWGWPLWAMMTAGLIAALQLRFPERGTSLRIAGGVWMLGLLTASSLLIWNGPGGAVKEAHWLARGYLTSGSVFIAMLWLLPALAGGVDLERVRQQLATALIAWTTVFVALTSVLYPWLQANSLHAETQATRFGLVLLSGVIVVMALLLRTRLLRFMPLSAIAIACLFVGLTAWRQGAVMLPSVPLVAVTLGALLPARRWSWALGLWLLWLASVAMAPHITYSSLLMHAIAGTATLALLLWLSHRVDCARSTAEAVPAHHDEVEGSFAPASRLPEIAGLAVGAGVLVLGGLFIAFSYQVEQTHFEDESERVAQREVRRLLHRLGDVEHLAEVLADQGSTLQGSQGALAITAAQHTTGYRPGLSLIVAPGGVVQQIYPPRRDDPLLGVDLLKDPQRGAAVRAAVAAGEGVWQAPILLENGTAVMSYRVPYYAAGGRFAGLVVARLTLPEALMTPSDEGDDRYALRIAFGPNRDALNQFWPMPGWSGDAERLARVVRTAHQHGPDRLAPGERHPAAVSPDRALASDIWLEVAVESRLPTPRMALPLRLQLLLGVAVLLAWLAMQLAEIRQRRQALLGQARDFSQMQGIFENSLTGKVLFDAEGQCVLHNAAAQGILKVKASEFSALTLARLERTLGPEFVAAVQTAQRDGASARLSYQGKGTVGQDLDVDFVLNRLELPDGRYLLIQVADLSAIHAGEQALRSAKEAAEAANLAKDNFLATMSHELRTPLNGMLGMAQAMQMPDVSEQKRLAAARTMISAGQALLVILNDILDVAKIGSGKLTLVDNEFSPARLLEEVMWLFKAQAESKGLMLRCDPAAPPGTYSGDLGRLRQMLTNLVANAVKFSERGEIVIACTAVDGAEGDTSLRFRVTDQGIGIAPEHQRLLFQPFTQAETGISRRFGGTGLGLALVMKLAQAMGGTAGVESELGKGSTFWFTARSRARGAGARRSAPASEAGEVAVPLGKLRGRVLVVDDVDENGQVALTFLALLGMTPRLVVSGHEAITVFFAEGPFDAVLMDVHMPEIDGLEATRRIFARLADTGAKAPPVIAMTADLLAGNRAACLAAGMSEFLEKPLSLESLSTALLACLPVADQQPDYPPPTDAQIAAYLPLADTACAQLRKNIFSAIGTVQQIVSLLETTSVGPEVQRLETLARKMVFPEVIAGLEALSAQFKPG